MAKDYVPPQLDVNSYHCPYCNVFAHQNWFQVARRSTPHPIGSLEAWEPVKGYKGSQCMFCRQFSFWQESTMIFPTISNAPHPSTDMPEDAAYDFNEAREVLARSPRSSAALLRLALQKLCKHLGQPGKNINDDIGALVKAGLSPQIQQALVLYVSSETMPYIQENSTYETTKQLPWHSLILSTSLWKE